MERRRYKTIGFLLVHLGDIPGCNMSAAIRTVECAVILGEVDRTLNDSIIIHLHKVAFADFLILGNKAFAMPAGNRKEVTAAYLPAVGVLINRHITGAVVR